LFVYGWGRWDPQLLAFTTAWLRVMRHWRVSCSTCIKRSLEGQYTQLILTGGYAGLETEKEILCQLF